MTRTAPFILVAIALALGGCSALGIGEERPGDVEALSLPEPETALAYETDVVGEPSDRVAELMEDSLALFRRQGDGARSLAFLRRRAEGDVDLARRILRSEGYVAGDATMEITPPPAPAPDAAAPEGERPPKPMAQVVVRLAPGPAYVLEAHVFVLPEGLVGPAPALPDAAELGSPVGRRAAAGGILAAEQALRARLRAEGRPWARIEGRRAVADPETSTLRVETRVDPGPFARFGDVRFEGLERVEPVFAESWRPWAEGEAVDVGLLTDWQKDLTQTDLFSAVSVAIPEDPPPAGPDGAVVAPVVVRAEEGPRRSISAGLRADTEDGPVVRASWLHRNVLGAGERLLAAVELGLYEQVLDVAFTKPQYLRSGQRLRAEGEIRNQETDAFDELGATIGLGIDREIGEHWTVGGGGLLEISQINDSAGDSTAELVGLPLFVAYDDTDDPLNRTDGVRGALYLTPFQGFVDGDPAPFLVADSTLAAYRTVHAGSGLVLAGRTRLASILAADLADVPQPRRLYAGGGGSVRGYASQMVGPLDAANDPVGGRSAFEVSGEVRARLWGDVGGVAFVDAGAVSRDVTLDFGAGLRWAAGLGLRYYSPVGPIRLDVAVPLNPRDVDDPFAAYFSIGQAF